MSKQSERKRRAIKKAKQEEKKPTGIQRPSYAREFIKWKRERPQKLLKELKEMGYLKDESNRNVREIDNKPSERDVSKRKKKTTS